MFEDGKTAADTYTAQLKEGASYSVVSPTITDFRPDLPQGQTTDANGQVTFSTFSLLEPGSYIVKIECDSIFAETHLQVLKATVRLDARGKNFKQSTQTKRYTVKLKSIVDKKGIKGERLYLKINGKTYKATTDAKGKATFKISKLMKKGKFTATIFLTDNPFYNDIIKNVKIRIV